MENYYRMFFYGRLYTLFPRSVVLQIDFADNMLYSVSVCENGQNILIHLLKKNSEYICDLFLWPQWLFKIKKISFFN